MDLLGGAHNFCWAYYRLRLAVPEAASCQRQERTPAMATGLTHHRWMMQEPLCYQVPLLAWRAPTR